MVKNWKPQNVAEWMAATNLWDLAEIFLAHKVNGEQLLNLSVQHLEVNMLAANPFSLMCTERVESLF